MICEHERIAFVRQQVSPESRRAYITCTECHLQGEMNLDELDDFEWPEVEYSNHHHFEVVLSVTGDRVGMPYINDELSASWREGTIYNIDSESWTNEYGGANADWTADERLRQVLMLPLRLAEMIDACSPDGEWDGAEIAEQLGDILDQFGVRQRCDSCGFWRAATTKRCWCNR